MKHTPVDSAWKWLRVLAVALFCLLASSANVWAQNTKGDRSVGNQRQVRETRVKSVKKKERAKTKDIAGRRLRTKDKSSANRANASYPQPDPYRSRPRVQSDRPAKATGRVYSKSPRSRERSWRGDVSGSPVRRVKPRSAEAARANVYPQRGAYVNNPSRKPQKPKRYYGHTRTATGQPIVRRIPQQKQRAWKGDIKGGPVGNPPSATGRTKNVYSQKNQYSRYTGKVKDRKERPISNSGVVRRAQRLGSTDRLLGGGGRASSASGQFIQRGRKNVYWGKFTKSGKAVTRDLAGRPLRTRNFRSMPAGLVGRDTIPNFGRKPGGDRAWRGQSKGYVSVQPSRQRAWQGDVAKWKLRRLQPKRSIENAGARVYPRKLSISSSGKAGRPLPGSGFQSRTRGPSHGGNAIPPRSPGKGAKNLSVALGRTKGQRPLKGGGSVSGRLWNNNRTPIDPRIPPAGAQRAGRFAGNMRRDARPGFGDQGEEFSGYIKTRKPLKGGGSVSGKLWNNNGEPVDVIRAGKGTQRASQFQGNIKAGRPLKGGGSVSGKLWNNNGEPIDVIQAGKGTQRASQFQGNIKAGKPLKGGGSVSGKLWNNNGEPIDVIRAGKGTQKASQFQGNVKAKRPAKGGGSVSGKLWNNNEEPILVRVPKGEDAKEANYQGRLKDKRGYKQNPNAADASILKKKPTPSTFKADGLQVRVKRNSYENKPNAVEGALKGIAPSRETVRASEYARGVKLLWKYKHNPNSVDEALVGRKPSNKWERGVQHAGDMKARYPYRHNPNSADEALKVIYLGKAYARIENYQGNTKMRKYNGKGFHPDSKFAHGHRDNVKEERTFLMDVKLFWAKLFKKSDTQPEHLKQNERRPRYDKREQGLWYD